MYGACDIYNVCKVASYPESIKGTYFLFHSFIVSNTILFVEILQMLSSTPIAMLIMALLGNSAYGRVIERGSNAIADSSNKAFSFAGLDGKESDF